MAKIHFKHTTHDTIKQLFVKKKTFRLLLATQITTLLVLGWFSYKLANYGYFTELYTTLQRFTLLLKSLINSML